MAQGGVACLRTDSHVWCWQPEGAEVPYEAPTAPVLHDLQSGTAARYGSERTAPRLAGTSHAAHEPLCPALPSSGVMHVGAAQGISPGAAPPCCNAAPA